MFSIKRLRVCVRDGQVHPLDLVLCRFIRCRVASLKSDALCKAKFNRLRQLYVPRTLLCHRLVIFNPITERGEGPWNRISRHETNRLENRYATRSFITVPEKVKEPSRRNRKFGRLKILISSIEDVISVTTSSLNHVSFLKRNVASAAE